jgi:predicted secreted protein
VQVTETTLQTTVRTRDGVETVDSSHTVERSENKSEEAADGGRAYSWCSLKMVLFLVLAVAMVAGLYYIFTTQRGFSPEKVP